MTGLAGAVVLAGYIFVAYGWSQLRGCNASLVDITWPGRYKGCKPDKGSSSSYPKSGNSGDRACPPGSRSVKGRCVPNNSASNPNSGSIA